jgi:hypothetical protein
MTIFSVGEVAIMQHCDNPGNEGRECTITGALTERDVLFCFGFAKAQCYQVETANGGLFRALPHQLRKRPSELKDMENYLSRNILPESEACT